MGRKKRKTSSTGIILVTILFLLVAIGTVAFAFKDIWLNTDGTVNPGTSDTPSEDDTPDKTPPPTDDELAESRTSMLAQADTLSRGYFYDEAIALLNKDPALVNDEVTAKIAEITTQKNSLVLYEGEIQHVFFHSLIIYPELAFDDKGHPAEGYNMWMTTVSEFKKMLPQLMDRGYVLYNITDTCEYNKETGKWQRKDIYLPAGKKPLIISQDDVNYYPYMEPDGFASRLVLDENNKVSTEVKTPTGEVVVTRDGDVCPILDDFVQEHPEFSYRGAKGILAVTGYSGIFGYRTTDPDDYTAEQNAKMLADAKAIANKLKESGWLLACHSYTHNGYFRDLSVTMDQIKYDTSRWRRDIGITTGDTNIYISPFGYRLENDDSRYRYLVEQGGFNLFCFVGSGSTIYYNEDNVIMPRFNLDGFQMTKIPEYINERFFNVDEVLDPARPPLILD